MLDPVNCGPVTLALPQDVQTQAYDYPVSLFDRKVHKVRRAPAESEELKQVVTLLKNSSRPLIIAGGGVHYSLAVEALVRFATEHQIPVAETQAGKGTINWDHPMSLGGIGVTGAKSANELAQKADVVIAFGSRLQDFTTESRTLFDSTTHLVQVNVNGFDTSKHNAMSLQGDCKVILEQLEGELAQWQSSKEWQQSVAVEKIAWNNTYENVTKDTEASLPSDAQVLGAIKETQMRPM